jgi:hypothetical protein
MSDPGWTWGDLAGELWARGIDIDEVSDAEIAAVLHRQRPEQAADDIAEGR